VISPFEDPEGLYLVLVAASGDACLWPAWAAVPDGWPAAHGPAERAECLAWIEGRAA
jgi:MbtH protein